jgi:hypothetical protein
MTDRSNFSPEEWRLLLESVMLTGIAVTAAEPSGVWGVLKESFAGGTALEQARLDAGSNPLVNEVADELATARGRSIARDGLKKKLSGTNPTEIKARCIETLRQVGMLLDAKAPTDASAFKEWLRQISRRVADASKEGGFLGIGGTPVSEAENATLSEISSALRLAA